MAAAAEATAAAQRALADTQQTQAQIERRAFDEGRASAAAEAKATLRILERDKAAADKQFAGEVKASWPASLFDGARFCVPHAAAFFFFLQYQNCQVTAARAALAAAKDAARAEVAAADDAGAARVSAEAEGRRAEKTKREAAERRARMLQGQVGRAAPSSPAVSALWLACFYF